MKLDQRDEGEYRIYAGALESRLGDGYIAAVVVSRVRGVERGPREAYRDDALACGHRWAQAEQAQPVSSGARRVNRMWCAGRESNPYTPLREVAGFKPAASTSFATRAACGGS